MNPDLSQFSGMTMSIGSIVELAFYLITLVYIIFSAILYYHWREYGTDIKVTTYTLTAFFATTIPLIIIMGVLTLIISN